jgi:hypothetical protein
MLPINQRRNVSTSQRRNVRNGRNVAPVARVERRYIALMYFVPDIFNLQPELSN